MGLDRVDLVYLHDPERHDLELAIAEGLPALEQLRSEGTVAAIGVGSMTSQALARSVRAADLDAIMVAGRYTLLEQPAAVEVLPACRDTGTAVVAASVFNSGLLASSEPLRAGRYEYGTVPDVLWEHLQEILAVCRNHDVLMPAAALQFPLRERMVRSVVIGSSRAEQVRENVELFNVEIPLGFWEELATLQRVFDEKGGSAC
jgi:D-threo-aldose 1-dehydrogenase